ncbi:MAG: hypothetical protein Q4Q07_08850 [Tissierellia bacterium]|nr:hypothetical protein [Tissierellia bacterium]
MKEHSGPKDYRDEILFLELKNNITIEDITLKKGLELPLLRVEFFDGIVEQKWIDDISLLSFLLGYSLYSYIDYENSVKDDYVKLKELLTKNLSLVLRSLFKEKLPQKILLGILRGLSELYPNRGDVICLLGREEEKIYNSQVYQYNVEENQRVLEYLTNIYEKVEEDDLHYPFALHRLSYLYTHTGQFLKAKLAEEKVIQIAIDEELKEEAREHLKEIFDYSTIEEVEHLIYQGYPREAWNLLERISLDYPYPGKVNYYKGAILIEEQEFLQAEPYLKKAVEEAPEEMIFREKLGYIYSLNGKIDEALNEYLVIDSIEENRFDILYNLGILYVQKNNKEQAIHYLKRAYDLSQNEELKNYIEKIEKSLEN